MNEENPDLLNPLAVWDTNSDEKCGNCSVIGTPCEATIRDGEHFIDSDLQNHFPNDEMMKKLDAESYMGVAMKDRAGGVIGVIVLVDSQPAPAWKKDLARAILPVFAARASAEIERRGASKCGELQNGKRTREVIWCQTYCCNHAHIK